jgi:hypothetical protein
VVIEEIRPAEGRYARMPTSCEDLAKFFSKGVVGRVVGEVQHHRAARWLSVNGVMHSRMMFMDRVVHVYLLSFMELREI